MILSIFSFAGFFEGHSFSFIDWTIDPLLPFQFSSALEIFRPPVKTL